MNEPLIKFRKYQEAVFWENKRRVLLLWARRRGKSFTLACKAMDRMMELKDHTCIFVSASILIGGEFLLKEAKVWNDVLRKTKERAAQNNLLMTSNADGLGIDDIADLFEHQKLETKIWHDQTAYSKSVVVAANPSTAVGWGGDIFFDEVGRVADLRDVNEAVQPFMRENPSYLYWMATTPPPDDTHYSFELFIPPDEKFSVNPAGNWFISRSGIPCHRVDAWDAVSAGVNMYDDDTGSVITPEQSRALDFDKTAWDRNEALIFVRGGTAAVSYLSLQRAMQLGKEQCMALSVTEEIYP